MHRFTGFQTSAKALFVVVLIALGAPLVARQPNVVLFLVDDLGWADLGLTGSTFYETPHVNRLAAEGAFFSDAYAASPICSPTRASILTGKYPSRIGLTNHSGIQGPTGTRYPLVAPHIVGNMPPEDITLAEALKAHGYTTAHVGKWHLQAHHQQTREHYPEANGFDVNIAGHKGGHPNSFHFPYKGQSHPAYDVPDLEDGQEGDYLTDALTDKAIEFIEDHRDQPFFLNYWFYTVHTPIEGRADKVAKYRQKAKALGLLQTNRPAAIQDYHSYSVARQDNAEYAAMVESMDENVGRVLDALKRLNLDEDTVVIFLSDNGGLSTGGGAHSPTSNLPLRAGKGWVYEGGIRTPLIIKYPQAIESGLRLTEPAVSTDLYPTILDLIGEPLLTEQHVDGLSLKPLLSGAADRLEREAIYFHYPHYHHINSMGPAGAVRAGDYKLVERFETGEVELYHLGNDPGEQTDLRESMPELAERLKALLHQWQQASEAQLPTRNPDYDVTQDSRAK